VLLRAFGFPEIDATGFGRFPVSGFVEFPSKKLWPGYYKVIKEPQCFENVFVHVLPSLAVNLISSFDFENVETKGMSYRGSSFPFVLPFRPPQKRTTGPRKRRVGIGRSLQRTGRETRSRDGSGMWTYRWDRAFWRSVRSQQRFGRFTCPSGPQAHMRITNAGGARGPGIGEGALGSVEDRVAHPGSGEHGTQQRQN